MPKIYFLPDRKKVETDEKTSILEASLNFGIPHTHVCGGKARCSTCRVMVLEGIEFCTPRTEEEQILADRLSFDPTIRLACQTKVTGNVNLRRLVLDEADAFLRAGLKRRWELYL
jgi:adenylate cyclase